MTTYNVRGCRVGIEVDYPNCEDGDGRPCGYVGVQNRGGFFFYLLPAEAGEAETLATLERDDQDKPMFRRTVAERAVRKWMRDGAPGHGVYCSPKNYR